MGLGSCPCNNVILVAIVCLQLLKPLVWVQEEEIELNCIYLGKIHNNIYHKMFSLRIELENMNN